MKVSSQRYSCLKKLMVFLAVPFVAISVAMSCRLHQRIWIDASVFGGPVLIPTPPAVAQQPTNVSFLKQNTSFFENLPCIYNWVNSSRRRYEHAELIDCNHHWAYIHVFKAGGSTIQNQCNTTSWTNGYENPIYLTHSLFTFVRDPIDHFIAGFIESASRQIPKGLSPTNDSILEYLHRRGPGWCFWHSAPQIEFLLYNTGRRSSQPVAAANKRTDRFLRRMGFIGDMKHMKQFFQVQGLPWNDTLVELRHYGSSNSEPVLDDHKKDYERFKSKTDYYGLRQRLSDEVIIEICNFVRIDYCFFDYKPPPVCSEEVTNFCQETCAANN